jgi:hypothetical protein
MVLRGDCGACFAALSPDEDALWLNVTVPISANLPFDDTEKIFSNPREEVIEHYISGRFG